jgi:hypothetical protein
MSFPIGPVVTGVIQIVSIWQGHATSRADLANAQAARDFEARQAKLARRGQLLLKGLDLAPLGVDRWDRWRSQRRELLDADMPVDPALAAETAATVELLARRLEDDKELARYRRLLEDYPLDESPGALQESLRLHAERPLLVLISPSTATGGPGGTGDEARWSGRLCDRVAAELGQYQQAGRFEVRVARRPFQWPHAALYQEDLAGQPTVVLRLTTDRRRLDMHLGGCHLGLDRTAPVQPAQPSRPIFFPNPSSWTAGELAALAAAVRDPTFRVGSPLSPDDVAELNHELAARVVTLSALAAVDAHNLIARPAYEEQLDLAVERAAIFERNWHVGVDLPLGLLADPAHHLLQRAARHSRLGEADQAGADLRLALSLLADPGSPLADSGDAAEIGALVGAAAVSPLVHSAHVVRARRLLDELYPGTGLGAVLAAATARRNAGDGPADPEAIETAATETGATGTPPSAPPDPGPALPFEPRRPWHEGWTPSP